MRWLDGITDSMDVSLSRFLEMVKEGKPDMLQSTESQRVRYDRATEEQQMERNLKIRYICMYE